MPHHQHNNNDRIYGHNTTQILFLSWATPPFFAQRLSGSPVHRARRRGSWGCFLCGRLERRGDISFLLAPKFWVVPDSLSLLLNTTFWVCCFSSSPRFDEIYIIKKIAHFKYLNCFFFKLAVSCWASLMYIEFHIPLL